MVLLGMPGSQGVVTPHLLQHRDHHGRARLPAATAATASLVVRQGRHARAEGADGPLDAAQAQADVEGELVLCGACVWRVCLACVSGVCVLFVCVLFVCVLFVCIACAFGACEHVHV
jgi:hypothetical protein